MTWPPDATPQSLLVLKATTPWGEALCRAFARKGARIAIQYRDDRNGGGDNDSEFKKAMEVASRAADRRAVALPLRANLPALGTEDPDGADEARNLIERVVDDFGRLDAVLYPAERFSFLKPNSEDAGKEAAAVANLLRAAAPHLRRSKPAGHFIILAPIGDEDAEKTASPREKSEDFSTRLADLETDLGELARRCDVKGSRPCLNIVVALQADELLDRPASLEETARYIQELTARRDLTGRALTVAQASPPA